ncbi:MAG TPA: UvrD-helicase domain-containing protein [Terriglobales bacterium]|nr:UvrD-helicase domain-containing protein [Terriglobales bacterium]
MSFLDQLNPQQREAVESTEGPLLILAGAGSGKTRVITYRIAHLIDTCGVAADSILAVTFTNKAAAEMAERVEKLVGGHTLAKPVIATFHSFCVRLLRRDIEALRIPSASGGEPIGFRKDFVIYDETDQQMVVKAAMRRLGVDDKQTKPSAVLSHISWAKNHMLDPQEVYLNSRDPKTERVAHIYEIYRQELRKANALDFDDLLLEAVRLLKAIPEVREKYNRRFQYILVDEYQDTNRPQYELMRLLAGTRHNVCAVGDEDQSIYSWRGADIRNILEFEKDFPDAKIIRLEQNYRSTQNILQAASAVVGNNVRRKGKNLWTSRQGGAKLGYYEAPDGENEALFVADYISRYLQESASHGDEARAAVLYRTNSQSRLFEEAMRRYGLKYHVVGGFSFYERAEIKDLISYLKVILNPDDSIALLRALNTPPRGIGKTTVETLEHLALNTGLSLWGAIGQAIEQQLVPARAAAALGGFKQIIDDGRAMLAGTFVAKLQENAEDVNSPRSTVDEGTEADGLRAAADREADDEEDLQADISFDFALDEGANKAETASDSPADREPSTVDGFRSPGGPATTAEILKFLIDRTGYIRKLEEEDTPEALSRIENLRELVNAAMDSRDRGETLDQFLDHAALISDTDQYFAGAQITLMTLHSAKGLEFPLVFLCGLEEGLFPHSRTLINPDDIEEERRLCYVGMTRAMNTLLLTRALYRRRYGTDLPEAAIPSRFLEEVPPQLLEDLGSPRRARVQSGLPTSWKTAQGASHTEDRHYAYEDEDQSLTWNASAGGGTSPGRGPRKASYGGPTYNSIDNIAEFFASRGKKFSRPKVEVPPPSGARGFRPGQRVRHPKYGEGTVYKREGEGEEAKITVQFPRFGLKKLVEKYAQLEKA